MKPCRNPFSRPVFLAVSFAIGLGQSAHAVNYWFDNNGTTAGFGVANLGSYDWTAGTPWTTTNTGAFTVAGITWPGGSNLAGFVGAGASTSYTMTLGATDSSTVTLQNLVLNSDGTNATAIGSGDVVIGGVGSTGTLFLNAANSIGTAAGTLTINSKYDLGANKSTNFRGGTVIINGVISGTGTSGVVLANGAFGLTSGTLTLAGDNTFTGGTSVASGYVLSLKHANALGATGGTNSVSAGGSMEVAGGAAIASGESVGIAGDGVSSFGALRAGTGGGSWSGGVTLNGTGAGPRLGATAGNTLTVTGVIANGSGNSFNVSGQSGTGVVVLNPTTSNSYTGTTGIIRGILRIGKTDALPTGTTLDVDSISSVSDAATFDLASFSQTVAVLQDSATSNINGKITNSVASTSSTLTVNQASNTTFDGVIENGSGSVILTKSGAGSLTFNGVNTFTGGTNIKNGKIIIGGGNDRLAATGSVVLGDVSSSGVLVLGDATTARNQTLAGLTTTGLGGVVIGNAPANGTLTLNIASGTNTFDGILGGAGTNENNLALTKSGAGALTLGGTSANTYAGLTSLSAGSLTLAKTAGVNAIPGNLSITNATTNLYLGASNQIADSSVISWAGTSGYGYLNMSGYSETVGGLSDATGHGVIQNEQTGTGKAATALVINNSSDYSFNGYFRNASSGATGTLGLVKLGSGKQTLSGAFVVYTGPTTISAGTLELTGATAFNSAVEFDAGSTGVLQMAGATGKINDLSTADATNNNVFVQNAAGTDNVLTINQAGNTSFGGIIRNNTGGNKIGIVKAGTGTLTLTNDNTFTGDVTVSAGTLRIGHSNALGTGTKTLTSAGASRIVELSGGITLANTISLSLSSNSGDGLGLSSIAGVNEIQGNINFTTGNPALNISSTSGSTLSISGNLTYSVANNTRPLYLGGTSTSNNTISGVISQTGTGAIMTLNKQGAGTWVLSNANTFTGATTITGGSLALTHNLALQYSALNTAFTGGGSLDLTAVNTPTIGGFSGAGDVALPTNVTSLTLNPQSGVSATYTGNLSGGTGLALTKTGAGTQILSGANSWSGLTTVNGGELRVTSAAALSGTNVVVSSGQFVLDGGISISGKTITTSGTGTNFVGGLQSINGTNTWEGNVVLGADLARMGARKDATLVISGSIDDGANTYAVIFRNENQTNTSGAGNASTITEISGANTYGGNTIVIAGVTRLAGGDNRLPTSTVLQFGLSGANAKFDMNGRNQEVAGLAVTSSTNDTQRDWNANELTNSSGILSTLTVNTTADQTFGLTTTSFTGSGNYTGKITGNIALVKDGSAKLTLSGTNTYTGTTTVTAGTLVINGNISTSTTTVQSGGTLAGAGTAGSVIVDNGGTLAPGNSPGTLTISGDLGLNDSSILAFELDPFDTSVGSNINDLVTGISNFTLDGLLNVTATSGTFDTVTTGTWRLFNYSGSLTNNILSLNSMPALASGYSWSLDTATAGQVNLTVVPEPGAALLGGLGMLALLRRRRG